MELIYNFLGLLAFAVIVGFVFAMVKPKKFVRFLGKNSTRPKLALIFFGALCLLGFLMTVTEPESYKLARIEDEKQKQEQNARDEDAKRQAEIADSEAAKQQAGNNTAPDPQPIQENPTNPRDYWHKVTTVVDGDTVRAMVDGKEESIRIIGIDSPESTTSMECYGQESSNKAKEFLNGKWIQLEPDNSQDKRDKYGRLLAYVWFDTGTDFGRRMIEEGFAFEYTYSKPYNKQTQYKETQEYAKSKQHGLWSTSTCNGQKQKPVTQTAPTTPAPKPTPQPTPAPANNCDPNYTGGCVPITSSDLDCGDIGFMVRVVGTDKHNFDGNHDGYGCESYN